MLDRPVQLLWPERDQVRECDRAELDGHMQDARNLDRQLVPWLGDPHVAHLALASGRVRPFGLWHRAWLLPHVPLSQLPLPRSLLLFLVLIQQSRTTPVIPTTRYRASAHRGGRGGGSWCATFVRRRPGRDGSVARRPWYRRIRRRTLRRTRHYSPPDRTLIFVQDRWPYALDVN